MRPKLSTVARQRAKEEVRARYRDRKWLARALRACATIGVNSYLGAALTECITNGTKDTTRIQVYGRAIRLDDALQVWSRFVQEEQSRKEMRA